MRRLVAGQTVTVGGRRMTVRRVETIDGVTYIWVHAQAVVLEKAA